METGLTSKDKLAFCSIRSKISFGKYPDVDWLGPYDIRKKVFFGYLRWTMVTSFYNHGHSYMLLSLRTIIFMRYPPYDKNTVFLPEFDDNMETLKLRSAKNFCTKPHQHVVDLPYNPLISINYQQYGIQSWGNFNLSQPFFFSDFPMRAGFIQQALLGVFFWCSTNHSRGPRG